MRGVCVSGINRSVWGGGTILSALDRIVHFKSKFCCDILSLSLEGSSIINYYVHAVLKLGPTLVSWVLCQVHPHFIIILQICYRKKIINYIIHKKVYTSIAIELLDIE